MKKNIEYFHITPLQNKDAILSQGIISEENEIFVSDSEHQLILIASSQIFQNEYSVFKILPNTITGRIIPDNVAEIGAKHQFIVKQNKINPECIIHLRDEVWNQFDLQEESLRIKYNAIGFDAESLLDFAVTLDKEWCEHYNKKHGKNLIVDELNFNSKPIKKIKL